MSVVSLFMGHNRALNENPVLRVKATEFARTECKAHKGGSKLRVLPAFFFVFTQYFYANPINILIASVKEIFAIHCSSQAITSSNYI